MEFCHENYRPAAVIFLQWVTVDTLHRILATKQQEVALLQHRAAELKRLALQRNDFAGFRARLDRGPDRLGVIAEIKKASPSLGLIDPNFNPLKQYELYRDGGAQCISILTDTEYFQGSLADLAAVAKIKQNPILRKDFIIDALQIYEAIIAGADAVLLIAAALDQQRLLDLYNLARDLQLDVLVEVHDMRELDRALDIDADLIGINNRDLKTFVTDLAVTERLAEQVPEDVLLVSESGIHSAADAQRVLNAGANAILVGESLMKADVPQDLLGEFLGLVYQQDGNEQDLED